MTSASAPVSVPHIETSRLLLREYRASDFDAFAANSADAVAMHHLSSGVLDRRTAWRHFLAATGTWLVLGVGWWGLEHKETGEFIGQVGAFRREYSPELELGWSIHRTYWRQGFASEAARAALRYAFDVLNVGLAIAQIAHANVGSIRVAERIGMRFDREVDIFGERYQRYVVDNSPR